MICTSVMPCLSSGLAKNNKIMSMFVLFSLLFSHFESLAFFESGGDKPYTKAVKQDIFSQFFKGSTICNNYSKKGNYFHFFKLFLWEKMVAFSRVFWDNGD